jgi:hypothetical protein
MFPRNKGFRKFLASWSRSQCSNLAVKTQVGEDVQSHLRGPVDGVGIRKYREACIETPVVAQRG